MRNRKLRIVLIALGLLAGLAAVLWRAEPRYAGRSLSHWIHQYAAASYGWSYPAVGSAEKENASAAIRHIGPAAVPYLLKWIEHEPRNPVGLQKLLQDLKARLGLLSLDPLTRDNAGIKAEAAALAFKVLGPQAASAVPELERLCAQDSRPVTRTRAFRAMLSIGQPAAAKIETTLTNANTSFRSEALLFATQERFPLLDQTYLWAARDPDPSTVLVALLGLSSRTIPASALIPAVAPSLKSPDAWLRESAADCLAMLGPSGSNAVPELLSMLNDPEDGVRISVTNALLQIAPEVLTNAPAQ